MSDRQYEYGINEAATAIIGICTKVIVVVLAVILLYLGVTWGFRFGRSIFYADPVDEAPGRDVEITVTENDSFETLAQKLYEAGIIPDEFSFVVQATLYDQELYPGTYTFNTSETIRDMILYIGETAGQYKTIAESEAVVAESQAAQDEVITGGGEGD